MIRRFDATDAQVLRTGLLDAYTLGLANETEDLRHMAQVPLYHLNRCWAARDMRDLAALAHNNPHEHALSLHSGLGFVRNEHAG